MGDNGARALLERIQVHGVDYIDALLNKQENRFLEFKAKSSTDGDDRMGRDDKRNYAKELSAFANANGGLLVWGVEDKTRQPQPITNLQSFREQLTEQLPNAVEPSIEGIQFKTIETADNEGLVAVFIPGSHKTPHRAELGEGRYYQRIGESAVKMEHYQIADMFGSRQRPKLALECSYKTRNRKPDIHQYELILTLINQGRSMCRYYGFELAFPKQALDGDGVGIAIFGEARVNRNIGRIRRVESDKSHDLTKLVYRSANGDFPIFPGERVQFLPNTQRIGYVWYSVDREICDKFNDRELSVILYADNAPKEEVKISFNDLNQF